MPLSICPYHHFPVQCAVTYNARQFLKLPMAYLSGFWLLITLMVLSGCGGSGDPDPAVGIDPPPPSPTARTWTFHGSTAGGSQVDGTFAYEKDSGIIEPPNANLYAPLTAWSMQVQLSALDRTVSAELPPILVFSSDTPGSPDVGFVEWSDLCFNHCESEPYRREMARLIFHNALHELRFVFVSPDRHTHLPIEIGDWGVFAPVDSRVDLWSDTGDSYQYRLPMRDGELVE